MFLKKVSVVIISTNNDKGGIFMNFDFKITEILTLPASIMAALSLASGILLFSPEGILQKLYMETLREKYGFYIGLVFVVSLSILIVNLIYSTANSISNDRAQKRFYAHAEERLKKLNNYQKAILFILFNQENRTFLLPIHDGAVKELEQKYCIGPATNQYMVDDLNNARFPYLIQPWVADELTSKPDLLADFKSAFFQLNGTELFRQREIDNYW